MNPYAHLNCHQCKHCAVGLSNDDDDPIAYWCELLDREANQLCKHWERDLNRESDPD